MSEESGQNQISGSKDCMMFDTSIIIDHLRKVEAATELALKVERKEMDGIVSSLAEAELLAGDDCSNDEKKKAILQLISTFTKVNIVNEIAQTAGDFKRKYKIPMDDCIIAAIAFHQKCKLWTKNTRDFDKIKEIETEEPY